MDQHTKLEWFDAGARALREQGPELEGSAADAPEYVCPICVDRFQRSAVENGTLTAEHVPPESLGGRELVLTCSKCNNIAGSSLDADAAQHERVNDAIAGRPGPPLKVWAHSAGESVSADFIVPESGSRQLQPPKKDYANKPGAWDILPRRGGAPLTVEFRRYSELGSNISWLKSGYLILFAVYGYPFVFDPAYDIVRSQIREPQRSLMKTWETPLDSSPSAGPMLVEVTAPETERGFAVVFARRAVFFPHLGDTTFYERLGASAGQRCQTESRVLGWPSKPLFGLPERGSL